MSRPTPSEKPSLALSSLALLLTGYMLVSTATSARALTFQPRLILPSGTAPYFVATADVNADGKQDVVVANHFSDSSSVFLGGGDGASWTRRHCANHGPPYALQLVDMNGDGELDIVISSTVIDFTQTGGVTVLIGDGQGGFALGTQVATGASPATLAAGDLNSDGKPDVAVPNYYAGTVSILPGDGLGGFLPKTDVYVGGNPQAVAIADLNADGKPDLVVANRLSLITIFPGDGTGAFSTRYDTFVTGDFRCIAVGDLNGDGKLDVVTANASSQTARVMLGNGTGALISFTTYPVGANPYSVAIADLDRDGLPDLAVANAGGSTVSVLLGTGGGDFAGQLVLDAGNTAWSVAASDLNGDGWPDLAVADETDAAVSILINNTPTSCAPIPPGLVAWWRLDGDAGEVLGHHPGTVVGGGGSFAPGRVSQGFHPDDSTLVQVPDAPELNPTEFTLDAWVKLDSMPPGNPIVIWKGDAPGIAYTSPFELAVYGTGEPENLAGRAVAVIGNRFAFQEIDSDTPMPVGQWVHLAMTVDGSEMRLYQNGALVGSQAQALTPGPSGYPLQIGGTIAHTWPNSFTGTIDEVEIHDSAATPQQILDIFLAGAAGKCPVTLGVSAAPDANVLSLAAAPNPSRGGLAFTFNVPRPSPVRLEIFDVAGRRIRSLLEDRLMSGAQRLEWDGRAATGAPVSGGLYFARVQAAGSVRTTRIVILGR